MVYTPMIQSGGGTVVKTVSTPIYGGTNPITWAQGSGGDYYFTISVPTEAEDTATKKIISVIPNYFIGRSPQDNFMWNIGAADGLNKLYFRNGRNTTESAFRVGFLITYIDLA